MDISGNDLRANRAGLAGLELQSGFAALGRRRFVEIAAATVLAPRMACAAEKPYLKVGFMTDTHVGWTKASCARVKGAFEVFRAQGVDAIGHCGDLADWHYPDGYKYYLETFEEAYAGAAVRPRLLYVYANHDALDPNRKDPKLCQTRMMDLKTAFKLMRERLKIDHGLFCETELNGVPFLVIPQSYSLIGGIKFVKERLAAACARHPTGPVVLLAHGTPANTCYNSGEWGDPTLRAALNEFPRVISFSGHTHGSLRNEQSVWQGEFTAVDVCCLQEWHGVSVGTPVKGKQAYGVLVAEFFPERVVLRRFDVRDGSEFKPNEPWVVTQPFAPATAPLAWATRANAERRSAFAPSAKLSFKSDAVPFNSLTVSFPGASAEEDVLLYKIEIHRRKDGSWERFARSDVFGEFYLRPRDRKGAYARSYCSSYFESGATYRFTVTPVGFFGAEGTPIAGEWTAPEKAKTETRFLCENPMLEMPCRNGWPTRAEIRTNAPVLTAKDGWYERTHNNVWVNFPDGVWKAPKGTKFRLSVDLRLEQPKRIDGCCLRIDSADGTRRSPCGWMTTPDGVSGLMRCVFEFTARSDAEPEYSFVMDRGQKFRFRFERFQIERLP